MENQSCLLAGRHASPWYSPRRQRCRLPRHCSFPLSSPLTCWSGCRGGSCPQTITSWDLVEPLHEPHKSERCEGTALVHSSHQARRPAPVQTTLNPAAMVVGNTSYTVVGNTTRSWRTLVRAPSSHPPNLPLCPGTRAHASNLDTRSAQTCLGCCTTGSREPAKSPRHDHHSARAANSRPQWARGPEFHAHQHAGPSCQHRAVHSRRYPPQETLRWTQPKDQSRYLG